MWNVKISDETVLEELKSGLSPEEIRDRHGLSKYWTAGPRVRRLVVQARKEKREQEHKAAYPVTTYRMSPEEIERRYGPPGAIREKKEYTFRPETGEKGKNRQIGE